MKRIYPIILTILTLAACSDNTPPTTDTAKAEFDKKRADFKAEFEQKRADFNAEFNRKRAEFDKNWDESTQSSTKSKNLNTVHNDAVDDVQMTESELSDHESQPESTSAL